MNHKELTNLLTYLLTYSMDHLEQLTGLQLVKKFPAFHGTRKFITALTSVRHETDQASHMWGFLNSILLQGRVVSISPNPQAGGPPLVGCPRLLIQYICSRLPYWRPSIRNLRTRHAVVTGTHEQNEWHESSLTYVFTPKKKKLRYFKTLANHL